MFEIGSYVIYRSEGVCVISDIRNESFGSVGKSEKYYILTPISDSKSTVFVPVNNEVLTGFMKSLMSADEINSLVHRLKDEVLPWQTDARARTTEFKEIIASGNRERLVLLLNTFRHRFEALTNAGKKISSAEMGIYSRAERLFYEELSATTDITSQGQVKAVLCGELVLGNKQ